MYDDYRLLADDATSEGLDLLSWDSGRYRMDSGGFRSPFGVCSYQIMNMALPIFSTFCKMHDFVRHIFELVLCLVSLRSLT